MEVGNTNSEILDRLNTLLTRTRDGERGYQEAAENVKDTELKSLFLAQSRQRNEYATEIDREIRTLGGDPENSTSLTADLHRAWINIKTTFTGNDDKAVVEECKRGDGQALEDYQEILQSTSLAASTRELLLRQKERIESAHASMARLANVV
ncbi:ferritin-like domain-containing protein [Larkinella humicola]|uniref:PA2169 family four-helix-bundle protein n=1 Tax=Larkinella humicola TaxID=2607654 RepID=A0A5N1JEI2_9BACT|nr:PA2169 family four-helix-bundle protein [Larkinella humicola]KAA9349129.1 PA2169 family four-helix-bundle protein [Larkinella humicola]